MKHNLSAACLCHTGKIRTNNEDNFYFNMIILPEHNYGLKNTVSARFTGIQSTIFAVFDGMGGEADGQKASFLAASTLQQIVGELTEYGMQPKEFLASAVERLNDAVWPVAAANFTKMGTTAVILYFVADEVNLCNVGDSRAFRLRQNCLQQLSEDHTDAAFLAKMGIVHRKPQLTQCIGVSPEEMIIEPYIVKDTVLAGDQYLLCSDGLTDMVSPDEINAILKDSPDAECSAERLILAALKNGGRDNITVIVIRVEASE